MNHLQAILKIKIVTNIFIKIAQMFNMIILQNQLKFQKFRKIIRKILKNNNKKTNSSSYKILVLKIKTN
jgi:hypothetical protein